MNQWLPHIPIPAGFHFLRRRSGVNPLIINYHMVSDEDHAYIKHLYHYRSIDAFKRDLDFYISRYQPVGLEEMLKSLKGEGTIPENALHLTFDDGFREVHEVIGPLLKQYEIPATFFITSDFLDNKMLNHDNKQSMVADHLISKGSGRTHDDILKLLSDNHGSGNSIKDQILNIPYSKRALINAIAARLGIDFKEFLKNQRPYMTTSQVKDLLEQGFTIGSHSLDHARFPELSLDDQVDQVKKSLEFLVDSFSIEYRVFAFPYSDRGVSGAFFHRVSGLLEASFGTHGLQEDPVNTHFQRISVEKYKQPARKTLKFHYARRMIYNSLGKAFVTRPNEPDDAQIVLKN